METQHNDSPAETEKSTVSAMERSHTDASETFAMALRLLCVCLSFCRRGDLDFAAHEDGHKYDGDEDDPA